MSISPHMQTVGTNPYLSLSDSVTVTVSRDMESSELHFHIKVTGYQEDRILLQLHAIK